MSISSEQFFKNFFEQVGGTEQEKEPDNKIVKYITIGVIIIVFFLIFIFRKEIIDFLGVGNNRGDGRGNRRGDGRGSGRPALFSNTDEEDTKQK